VAPGAEPLSALHPHQPQSNPRNHSVARGFPETRLRKPTSNTVAARARSYTRIPVTEAVKILVVDDEASITDFIAQGGDVAIVSAEGSGTTVTMWFQRLKGD
jgi:hypothetical protein